MTIIGQEQVVVLSLVSITLHSLPNNDHYDDNDVFVDYDVDNDDDHYIVDNNSNSNNNNNKKLLNDDDDDTNKTI